MTLFFLQAERSCCKKRLPKYYINRTMYEQVWNFKVKKYSSGKLFFAPWCLRTGKQNLAWWQCEKKYPGLTVIDFSSCIS